MDWHRAVPCTVRGACVRVCVGEGGWIMHWMLGTTQSLPSNKYATWTLNRRGSGECGICHERHAVLFAVSASCSHAFCR